MLLYYICSEEVDNKSQEMCLAKELQRNGFDLWSKSIIVSLGRINIYQTIDDYFGDTVAAITVVNENFFEDEIIQDLVLESFSYPTISQIYVLKEYTKRDFLKKMLDKYPANEAIIKNALLVRVKDGIKNITSGIGLYINERYVDKGKIPTGIPALDYLLNGGLPKASACNIIGPSGSGKTTLALQCQKNALELGYGCLYITYSEPPLRLLSRMESLGCDIISFIKNGKFRIYDSYSSLHGVSEKELEQSLGFDWNQAIIRVDDPYDAEAYFQNQIEAIKQIGPGGLNIIDSSNVRYEIAKIQELRNVEKYKEHFSHFKAIAGDTLKSIGAHIVDTEYDNKEIIAHLTRVEDGNIILKQETDLQGGVTRWIRIGEKGQIGRGDHKWYEYAIDENGIKILPTDFKD